MFPAIISSVNTTPSNVDMEVGAFLGYLPIERFKAIGMSGGGNIAAGSQSLAALSLAA
jgi:hypothetical protein